MKNKIIVILIIVTFVVGLAQVLLDSNTFSTDATAGATQDSFQPNIDQQTGATITGTSGDGVLIDEITGATITSGSSIDAISGASTSSNGENEYEHEDDEHEEHEEHDEYEYEFEWEFDD